MSFGVYVHIPYCLQRCTYCDFATYEQSKIMPSLDYIQLLKAEIDQRAAYHLSQKNFESRTLDTLYFGGGTPSLLPSQEIVSVISHLAKHGYHIDRAKTEVTIEINPATVDPDKLSAYIDAGINRFSVGAQTFDDVLLKMVHREHTAKQTYETLELLARRNVNFSFDILFALPTQTLAGVHRDLKIAAEFGASHVSPYCLTVPEGHSLSARRAPEEEQVEMFDLIWQELSALGYLPYEISNFAKPGLESRHNLLYWTDQEYWGLGLSAHSYKKSLPWGLRYWNQNSIGGYSAQITSQLGGQYDSPDRHLPSEQYEALELHQSLTDYCHTSLRLMAGLSIDAVEKKYSAQIASLVRDRLNALCVRGLLESRLENNSSIFSLSKKGVVLSNLVFSEVAFLPGELTFS
jgi:oxygen-independent coproporphyrinogen III oxidase